jgi:hypothetical protein
MEQIRTRHKRLEDPPALMHFYAGFFMSLVASAALIKNWKLLSAINPKTAITIGAPVA